MAYVHRNRFWSSGEYSNANPSTRNGPSDIAAVDDDGEAYEVNGKCDAESGPRIVGVMFGCVGRVVVKAQGNAIVKLIKFS